MVRRIEDISGSLGGIYEALPGKELSAPRTGKTTRTGWRSINLGSRGCISGEQGVRHSSVSVWRWSRPLFPTRLSQQPFPSLSHPPPWSSVCAIQLHGTAWHSRRCAPTLLLDGHIYDAVLEHNHHSALPDPQRHQASGEEWYTGGRKIGGMWMCRRSEVRSWLTQRFPLPPTGDVPSLRA
jgi:hypothetical protein